MLKDYPMNMTSAPHDSQVADAAPDNPVDRYAPNWLKPFARLARWDRPIGGWLLFWPCAWSAALAPVAAGAPHLHPGHVILFFIGSFAMRGAGCTWNDIVDRDIDAKVARTASRPLPSGQTTTKRAAAFLALQLLAGLLVLLQFNSFAIATGFAAMLPVITYPFMKRITWWPQANLGLCFAWGALMGWAAWFGSLDWPALLLYAGGICWVIGYDTIYALQDVEDDALVGVHSTARLFGDKVGPCVGAFYAGAAVLIGWAVWLVGGGAFAWIGLALYALHLGWQIARLDPADSKLCLRLFKSNSVAALLLFAGLAADAAL